VFYRVFLLFSISLPGVLTPFLTPDILS